jgi:hypothetical protein
MHDLGKAVMPMEVLNKPGKLSQAEFDIIKSHPTEGHKMLLGGRSPDPIVLDVCLHHHEKADGSGYPKGLKSDEISLFAKMGAVCDVYDAITSNRPYKSGWDPAESLRTMAEWANGHFDPKVFQAFVKSMGIYPVGSLVRLTSGRIGVVIEQTGKSLTTPSVKVFFSTKSNMRILPQVIDLSRTDISEKIVSRENPRRSGTFLTSTSCGQVCRPQAGSEGSAGLELRLAKQYLARLVVGQRFALVGQYRYSTLDGGPGSNAIEPGF